MMNLCFDTTLYDSILGLLLVMIDIVGVPPLLLGITNGGKLSTDYKFDARLFLIQTIDYGTFYILHDIFLII